MDWLLLNVSEKYGPKQGYSDGVNFISFAFNYDATQIIADLPYHKVWSITRRRSWKTKIKTNLPTLFDDYAIDYLKSKWFKLWKLRDPKHPYKDKLDKNGNVKLKSNGKPEQEIDAIAYICIQDAFGFYQRRFTTVSESLVKQGYVSKADHDEIVRVKDMRDEFDNMSLEEIKHYCHLELVTFPRL